MAARKRIRAIDPWAPTRLRSRQVCALRRLRYERPMERSNACPCSPPDPRGREGKWPIRSEQ